MTSKEFLHSQKLKLIFKKFQKKERIWKIIVYGSILEKEKNRDVDIAILIKEETNLKEKLELSSKLKLILKKEFNFEFDIKTIEFEELENSNFLARQGIFFGYLILDKKYLSEIFGFKPFVIFSYSLKNLNNSEKTRFYYALNGRRNLTGILKELSGRVVGLCAVKVPFEKALEFEEFLTGFKIEFKKEKILSPFW